MEINIKEDDILISYFDWVRIIREQDSRYRYIVHPANEFSGKLSWGAGRARQRKGVAKGLPDILGLYPIGKCPGFAMEFKSQKGKISEDQLAWLSRLSAAGWMTSIVRSFEEAKSFTERYFNLLK
jgi:hypothetical protein